MDLVKTLVSKINLLPEADYSPGLRAVLLHVETAFRHLSRGQEQDEKTAFTDAIYRTNQAFEGSIKEAYHVLAGKDPAKMKPFAIENYLEKNSVFHRRVLVQFTNYRQEWRNPSTHDYKLVFDESEAFLAIVSVCAFACVLIDQISERIAFAASQKDAEGKKEEIKKRLPAQKGGLLDRVSEVLKEFSRQDRSASQFKTEVQLVGALAGFLASVAPKLKLAREYKVGSEVSGSADFLIADQDSRLLIEVKRSVGGKQAIDEGIVTLEHYMLLGGIKEGILYIYPPSGGEMTVAEYQPRGLDGRILVMVGKTQTQPGAAPNRRGT